MVRDTGHMFHIDFGFILGKNPPMKDIWVPPIRINKPMMTGMGGVDSRNYLQFKITTTDAFLYIRKHKNLLMNLVSMMVDAKIFEVSEFAEILQKMYERFMPELNDEEASRKFMGIIDESVNHKLAEVFELQHRVAVNLR